LTRRSVIRPKFFSAAEVIEQISQIEPELIEDVEPEFLKNKLDSEIREELRRVSDEG